MKPARPRVASALPGSASPAPPPPKTAPPTAPAYGDVAPAGRGVPGGRAIPFSVGKLLWSTLLSVGVLVVISYHTFELSEFTDFVNGVNPVFFGAALATLVARVFFGGWRISYLSHGRLTMAAGIRAQLAWDFFSNVSPSAIGGGPFAAIYVARDQRIKVGEATALMLMAILMDQVFFAVTIPALLLAMPFVPVFPPKLGPVGTTALVSLFLGLLAWVVVFGYAVLFRPELLQRLLDALFRLRWLRRFRERIAAEAAQFAHYAKDLRRQSPTFFANGFLLTLASWMSRYLLPLFIMWSVYPDFDKTLMLLRTAAMSVGASLLPTPGGSGGIEWLYLLFIGPPLVPAALVAPTLLVWRVLGYYLFLGLGVLLTMEHMHTSIRRERRRRPARAADAAPLAADPEGGRRT